MGAITYVGNVNKNDTQALYLLNSVATECARRISFNDGFGVGETRVKEARRTAKRNIIFTKWKFE